MKKLIGKTLRTIYNFKTKEIVYPVKSTWNSVKWFMARSIRNTTILASFVLTGYVSAISYNYLNPIVRAETNTVTTEVKIPLTIEDFPLLVRICKAESGGKQFKTSGSVIRGIVNPSDIGICQINEPIWNDQARSLGYDIYTEKGNKDMAIWLFVRYGSQPWNASKKSPTNPNGWSL